MIYIDLNQCGIYSFNVGLYWVSRILIRLRIFKSSNYLMKKLLLIILFALTYSTNAQDIEPSNERERAMLHHVYFTLNNADSETDRQELIKGLRTLETIKGVNNLIIGELAPTVDREVIVSDWQLSLIIFFESVIDQDAYQIDPIHLQFVSNYNHLWNKVVVYDVLVDEQ